MYILNLSAPINEWNKPKSYYNFDMAPGQLVFAVAVCLVLLLVVLCKP